MRDGSSARSFAKLAVGMLVNRGALALVALLPAPLLHAATASIEGNVVQVLATGDGRFGGCMAALDVAPADSGLDCAGRWVTFSCTGEHAEKEAARRMFESLRAAVVADKSVEMRVTDEKKHGQYCHASRIKIQDEPDVDEDSDGDGVLDLDDDVPLDASETVDTDDDGVGNNADTDDDNDGTLDVDDDCPLDPDDNCERADLTVESPSVSDSNLNAGASFTFSATVRNQGIGQSAATTLRYYRSTNATISRTDTEVGTDAVGGLAASAASVESISLTAPSSAGTYYYGACVGSVSGESDTTNNCSSAVRVTVGGDAAVTLEITQCSGRVITFGSVLVTIRGTVQAHRSVTSAYVTGTANDRHVRRVPLGSISAGDSENFTMIGTITTFASTLRCSVLVESRELR